MNKTTLALICVIALLVGGFAAWLALHPSDPVVEIVRTDGIVSDIKDLAEAVTARIASRDEKIKTEVRVVYEQTRTRINALPADSVADGLNAELASFRAGGLADRPGGLDGN
jgi:hypothetical protein